MLRQALDQRFGKIKLWQLQNLEKIYRQLGMDFDYEQMGNLSRLDLKELTAKARAKLGNGKTVVRRIRPRIDVGIE